MGNCWPVIGRLSEEYQRVLVVVFKDTGEEVSMGVW